jgi:Tfp pilus assembly protein PilF
MVIGAQHWLAVCLVQQGQAETARSLYESALALAHEHQYRRMIARNQLHLALLDLGQGGAARAMERLEECLAHTGERDWEQHARIQQTRAEIFLRMGDRARAGEALVRASTLFERMGLTLESQAARATYATLT